MTWYRQATNHYMNQCWQNSATTHSTSKPYRVKVSVSPPQHIEHDAYMHQWSRSSLVKLMACRQAITCTNNDILSFEHTKQTLGEIWAKTCRSSFNLMDLKWASYIYINAYVLSFLSMIYFYDSINKFWTSCRTFLLAAQANALAPFGVTTSTGTVMTKQVLCTCTPQCRYDAASMC